MKVRIDILALVLVGCTGLAALALAGGRGPEQPAPWTPVAVATFTPTPTATPGWWNEVTTPTPFPLPTLPSVGLDGVAPEKEGEEVKFEVVSCPTSGVQIENIIAARPFWWNVYGTAAIPNLWYWKAELSPDGEHWTMLYQSGSPVAGGLLLEFHTRTVLPGVYFLRLTAVDRTGNFPEPCTVKVEVKR